MQAGPPAVFSMFFFFGRQDRPWGTTEVNILLQRSEQLAGLFKLRHVAIGTVTSEFELLRCWSPTYPAPRHRSASFRKDQAHWPPAKINTRNSSSHASLQATWAVTSAVSSATRPHGRRSCSFPERPAQLSRNCTERSVAREIHDRHFCSVCASLLGGCLLCAMVG